MVVLTASNGKHIEIRIGCIIPTIGENKKLFQTTSTRSLLITTILSPPWPGSGPQVSDLTSPPQAEALLLRPVCQRSKMLDVTRWKSPISSGFTRLPTRRCSLAGSMLISPGGSQTALNIHGFQCFSWIVSR